MLKKEGEISDAIIENMLSWRHSVFLSTLAQRFGPMMKKPGKTGPIYHPGVFLSATHALHLEHTFR
jgi:hypothetical protein